MHGLLPARRLPRRRDLLRGAPARRLGRTARSTTPRTRTRATTTRSSSSTAATCSPTEGAIRSASPGGAKLACHAAVHGSPRSAGGHGGGSRRGARRDLGAQQHHGVRYLTYWFDPDAGSVFCLAEGPSKEAVEAVHREAHGLLATTIIEVEPGLGAGVPRHDPRRIQSATAYEESAVRAVLFTDICGSTALTQRLGDDASTALLREHDALVRAGARPATAAARSSTWATGSWRRSRSSSAAVEAAIEIQRAIAERNAAATTPLRAAHRHQRRRAGDRATTTCSAPPCNSPPACARAASPAASPCRSRCASCASASSCSSRTAEQSRSRGSPSPPTASPSSGPDHTVAARIRQIVRSDLDVDGTSGNSCG